MQSPMLTAWKKLPISRQKYYLLKFLLYSNSGIQLKNYDTKTQTRGKNLFSTDSAINRTKLRDGLDMQILDRDFKKIILD